LVAQELLVDFSTSSFICLCTSFCHLLRILSHKPSTTYLGACLLSQFGLPNISSNNNKYIHTHYTLQQCVYCHLWYLHLPSFHRRMDFMWHDIYLHHPHHVDHHLPHQPPLATATGMHSRHVMHSNSWLAEHDTRW